MPWTLVKVTRFLEEPADTISKVEEDGNSRFLHNHWELSTRLCGITFQKTELNELYGAESFFRRQQLLSYSEFPTILWK
jgi:hypothetical protein